MSEIEISKVAKNLKWCESVDVNARKTPIVLVLGGSFAPIHRMHLRSFHSIKKKMDDEERCVVGAYLVPSTDSYVTNKLKKEAISLNHRNAMIEEAIKDDYLIENFSAGRANAYDVADLLEIHLNKTLKDQLSQTKKLQVYNIVGADLAVRAIYLLMDPFTIVVGRGEYTKKVLEMVKMAHIESEFKAILIEEDDMIEMSSTEIRNAIKENNLLESHMHPNVIKYISSNIDEIYK